MTCIEGNSIRQHLVALAVGLGIAAMAAGPARATQIMVVDFDIGATNTYDQSTGGDSTAGLTGSGVVTRTQFSNNLPDYWNSSTIGFLQSGVPTDTATWTVTGYAPGAAVNVYAHWRQTGQGNCTPDAPYSVNGGAAVTRNQRVPPAANLVLNDGLNDLNFELLGSYVADGAGQVQVILSPGSGGGSGWTVVDAMAFETAPPPPPTVSLPATAQVLETETLTLNATLGGSTPSAMQWKTNGIAVPGATSNPLVYTNIQLSQSGLAWSLEASNAAGSDAATTTVTVVEGTPIIVVDADNTSWAAYDASTGAENTNGLSAFFTGGGLAFLQAFSTAWNGEHGGYAEPGHGDTAVWTVSGYAPGATVSVYVHWHHQANTTPGMPYIVNGGFPVVKYQMNVPPIADLTLTDPLGVSQPFELVGQYPADGAGQVQVTIGNPQNGPGNHDFGNVDAVALETMPAAAPTVTLPRTLLSYETDTLTLNAMITGAPYPALQWMTNGIAVPGATNNRLVYTNLLLSQSGLAWSLAATNAFGAAAATTTVKVVAGTQIMVVDADSASWSTYDGSTGAENTNGLTGGFSSTGLAFRAEHLTAFNISHGGYAQPGHGDRAEWTVTGYTPGTIVRVYGHWHHQQNTTPGMPYIVNGGMPVVKHQQNSPPAGHLLLVDPQPVSQPFEVIDLTMADGAGQVQVTIGDPMDGPGDHDFGNVDAMAFETLSSAPFSLIEDFESHQLSNSIDSAGGWVEFVHNNPPANGTVVSDPTNSANRVASLTGVADNDGYILDLGGDAIADLARATLFFRYRSSGSMSAYLTDSDTLHPPNWWAEDEAGIYNNINVGDGSAVRPLWNSGEVGDIDPDTWYNVWVVVDHVADIFSLHLSRDLEAAIGDPSSMTVDAGEAFRSGAGTGDLDHFFFVSNDNVTGGMIDDIYIAQGVNLEVPDALLPPSRTGTLLIVR